MTQDRHILDVLACVGYHRERSTQYASKKNIERPCKRREKTGSMVKDVANHL